MKFLTDISTKMQSKERVQQVSDEGKRTNVAILAADLWSLIVQKAEHLIAFVSSQLFQDKGALWR